MSYCDGCARSERHIADLLAEVGWLERERDAAQEALRVLVAETDGSHYPKCPAAESLKQRCTCGCVESRDDARAVLMPPTLKGPADGRDE